MSREEYTTMAAWLEPTDLERWEAYSALRAEVADLLRVAAHERARNGELREEVERLARVSSLVLQDSRWQHIDDARELEALRARVADLETALRALRDAAEASDDSLYGTLGTGFVRSVVDGALGLSANKEGSRDA